MNCKPGDLAVTVGMVDANNGLIVEVIALTDCRKGWICTAQRTIIATSYADEPTPCLPGDRFSIADVNLRPISGVPLHDEQHDEVKA